MKKKIYLITGAAGFLGGTICRQLLDRGDMVRAFVLPNDPAIKYVPKEAEIVTGDLCNRKDLELLFQVPENYSIVVLHIASIVTVNPEYNQKVMDVNVGGTRNIIEMCEKTHCEKLVYCSSTGAIPEQSKGVKIGETNDFTTLDSKKVVGCYSQSKAQATKLVLDAAQRGLNACVVHPSGILGPGDFAVGETTSTMIQIINGEMPMGIDGSFNLCDVRDLAAGTIAAADKGKAGACYVLGNEEVKFRDFVKLIAEESDGAKIKHYLPISWAYRLAKVMEKFSALSGKKPIMTTFSVYNLARNNDFDSSKAQKELGYVTRTYRETIRDEIAWLKQNGKIGGTV